MKEKPLNSFKSSDVEFAINLPSFLSNKDNKRLDELISRFMPVMDYAQAPILKLGKYFGKSLGRLIGFGNMEYKAVRLKEHLITTHDGAKLTTDVYLPEFVYKNKWKAPTILVRLPYWKNMTSILGYLFASKGYVTVLQDMRGCASSSNYSTFALTYFVRQDGLETLKWITDRFWYNGKIGMWGVSFLGITQLGVAWDNNNLLTCLSPAQCSFTSVLYHPGGLNPFGVSLSVFNLVSGITSNVDPSMTAMITGDNLEVYRTPLNYLYNEPLEPENQLKLSELSEINDEEKLTNILNEHFNLNLKFNEKDSDGSLKIFMEKSLLGKGMDIKYKYLPYAFGFDGNNFETPMLVICSHYDMFIEQFLSDLKLIQKNSPKYFKKNFKMIIAPGGHGGLDYMAGIQETPPKIPNTKEMFSLYQSYMPFWWYDYWLKGIGKDLTKIPPIRMFILNSGKWRNLSRWPPKSTPLKLYLHSNGRANTKSGDGRLLEKEPENEPPDEFDFDPANPVVTKGGRFLFLRSGALNQIMLEERKDVLCFTTEKLREGIEVIGDVKIIFYASSSAKDTDFTVKLVDIYNKNKAINIVDSGIRARFRDGIENPSFIEPDKVYKYEISVGATGIYFPKDHKIRIEISSSNFPRFDVNSNLGGEHNENGYIIAHQKIFHNNQYPSHLILPVFKGK